MMSLRINIGSSFVAESAFSAALQQCLSLYLRLPSPSTPWSLLQPILPGPHTGDEPVTPQPSAHLCPQPSALPPPGCSSNKSWSCRKDLHSPSGSRCTNILCIPEEQRGCGASPVGTRALYGLCSSLCWWDTCWVIRVANCNL